MIEATLSATQLPLENYRQNQLNTITETRNTEMVSRENFYLETDKVTLSYSSESILTYSSSLTIEGTQDDGFDLLRGLVLNILKEQGIDYQIPVDGQDIDLSNISRDEAQELIKDDGYFGVEQTSNRIVDFAIGLSGGDPSRLEAIKQGVEQGFQEALDAFGGWLPEISYQTYDAVMEKLDLWAGISHSSEA
jgi:hypothetical protein